MGGGQYSRRVKSRRLSGLQVKKGEDLAGQKYKGKAHRREGPKRGPFHYCRFMGERGPGVEEPSNHGRNELGSLRLPKIAKFWAKAVN